MYDKNETSYRISVRSEKKGVVLWERIQTADDDVKVTYGENEKLGTVVMKVESIDLDLQLFYSEEGIVAATRIDKRLVGHPKDWIYFKETCRVSELMKDWEKVL